MILRVLCWLAAADLAAAVVLAGVVYAIGKRTATGMTTGKAVGLAVLLGSPAALLYLAVWLLVHLE